MKKLSFLLLSALFLLSAREEYYIRMMQAWYFATALAKQWDATLPVIDVLPEWVRRKTIQKAKESFRVSEEKKQSLIFNH